VIKNQLSSCLVCDIFLHPEWCFLRGIPDMCVSWKFCSSCLLTWWYFLPSDKEFQHFVTAHPPESENVQRCAASHTITIWSNF